MVKKIESLYIHFPFCKHLCNYCDFYKVKAANGPSDLQIREYYSLLDASFTKLKAYMNEHGQELGDIKTLYIGGGTPSLWGKGLGDFIESFFKKNLISFANDYEFTLECNPDSLSEEKLQTWKSFGVNRFSLGVQSLDPEVFKYLDRLHPIKDSLRALDLLANADVNFSLDFMLGLAAETGHQRDIENELREILKFSPAHISLYILKVNSKYPHFKRLPGEEFIEREYFEVRDSLNALGYEHYEVSNYAKPGYASKHNQKYWRSESVLALGPSATGYFSETKMRYKWKTSKIEFEKELLNSDQSQIETIYLKLRTSDGVDPHQDFQDPMQISTFKNLANSWIKEGLATECNNVIRATTKGYLLMDTMMDQLFSHKVI